MNLTKIEITETHLTLDGLTVELPNCKWVEIGYWGPDWQDRKNWANIPPVYLVLN